MEGDALSGKIAMQNTKETGPERNLPHYIIVKTLKLQNKKSMWQAIREKSKVVHEDHGNFKSRKSLG